MELQTIGQVSKKNPDSVDGLTHVCMEGSIHKYLPEDMLNTLSDDKHECTGCATRRPDLVGHNIKYTLKDKSYRRCRRFSFGFPLNKAEERKIIDKWIMMDLAWS